MVKEVYVLGGAGFVGSAIVRAFLRRDAHVTVVDGFLPRTGADAGNLEPGCTIIRKRIEALTNGEIEAMSQSDVIVDAMAWTSHLDAWKDPNYDLTLNVVSHLTLLTVLPEGCHAKLIYLGSRGQYGRNSKSPIKEGDKLEPDDIQGIHKTTADHYFRVFTRQKRFSTIALRFPNCYGPGQKCSESDIGLIGGFIRSALVGQTVEVFGEHRCRNIVFVDDVAECVVKLSEQKITGYEDYNLSGVRMNLMELARLIVNLAGGGNCQAAQMPAELSVMDMGDIPICDDKLIDTIGRFSYIDTGKALKKTIDYFRGKCNDLAL